MRERRKGKKLGRNTSHRLAMLNNLVTSLFTYGKIKTTVDRAKETSRLAAKLITMAKTGTLHHRRLAATYIKTPVILKKLFEKIAPSYKERMGGYTRIYRLGYRPGDGAEMALLELVQTVEPVPAEATEPVAEQGKPKKEKKIKKEKKAKEEKK